MSKRVLSQPASLSFEPASGKERVLLENLAQLYYYDFSEVRELYVAEDGRFADIDLTPYWVDEWRHPFLLRVDDKLAGFALVSERSKITGKSGVCDIVFCRDDGSSTGLGEDTGSGDERCAAGANPETTGHRIGLLPEYAARQFTLSAKACWRQLATANAGMFCYEIDDVAVAAMHTHFPFLSAQVLMKRARCR